jgi:hypothetical protein
MKKIIYLAALFVAISLVAYTFLVYKEMDSDLHLSINVLIAFFLAVFGSYGLYAELLFNRFRKQGKTENLCVEAGYYIQNKGFISRLLLFPFLKIKSSNSLVISFLGASAWIAILMIIFQAFKK